MIYVLSGAGTKLFAAIGVTYPAGSTVTCTNGTKTLTAKTTSGQWVFAIPEAGTWTVTAGTKSKSVAITTEGQFESVNLAEIVLYDGENGGVSTLAGSFIYLRDSDTADESGYKITFNTNNMVLPGVYNYTRFNALATGNKIDLSEAKTLYLSYTAAHNSTDSSSSNNSSTTQYFGVTTTSLSNNTTSKPTSSAAAKVNIADAASEATISLDISSISDSCHVFVESVSRRITVYRIWAE